MDNNGIIRSCDTYKYLGVRFSKSGTSDTDIANTNAQGKKVIHKLNSVMWNDKMHKETKTTIYKVILKSTSTYGCEVWELIKEIEVALKRWRWIFTGGVRGFQKHNM